MERLTFDELLIRRAEWDAAVDDTEGIDSWSTGSDWAFAAHRTWGAGPEVVLSGHHGFAMFGRLAVEGVDALVGPDPVWAFSAPLVGPNPEPLALQVCDALDELPDWDVVFLTGLVEHSRMDAACIRAFGRRHALFVGPNSDRLVADIDDVDAWSVRRSERFRRNLRRARRAADSAGLSFTVLDSNPIELLMPRLLAIEATSWKGQESSGLLGGDMAAFYKTMGAQLQGDHRLRVTVAMLEGRDVGFVLGAVRGRIYRGLQLSFSAGFEALSIGHLLQDHELHRVAAAGVHRYDLGMDMEYKHRWADRTETTRTIVVRR